jgi:hypothetical protein
MDKSSATAEDREMIIPAKIKVQKNRRDEFFASEFAALFIVIGFCFIRFSLGAILF